MAVVKGSAAGGASGTAAETGPTPRMALRGLSPSTAYGWVLGGILALMAATIALAVAVY